MDHPFCDAESDAVPRVREREAFAAARVLDCEHRGVEDETPFDVGKAEVRVPRKLRPQVVPRQVRETHVDQFVIGDEGRQRLVAMPLGDGGVDEGRPQAHGDDRREHAQEGVAPEAARHVLG